MPAVPEQLLSVRLSGCGRAVLDALWSSATIEGAGEGWTAARVCDLAQRTTFHRRNVERALETLRELGLVQRACRAFAGRQVEGFRLCPVALRQKAARRPVATGKAAPKSVAIREKSHGAAQSKREDMATIAAFARRGDSEMSIAERLKKARAKCSEGEWHNIKVHRRIAAMRRELGITPETRLSAGDVVHRWKMVNGAD